MAGLAPVTVRMCQKEMEDGVFRLSAGFWGSLLKRLRVKQAKVFRSWKGKVYGNPLWCTTCRRRRTLR